MVNIEPYVYINKVSINDKEKVYLFFKGLEESSFNNENFYGLQHSTDYIRIFYSRVVKTFDFSFDSKQEQILTEEASKIVNAELILNLHNNTLIIWGRPSIINYINIFFQKEKYFNIIKSPIDFETFYKNFNGNDTLISEVSFKDIMVLNKYVSLATFNTSNSNDALYLIKNLGANVKKVKLNYYSTDNYSVELDTNLEDCYIKINFECLNTLFIEDLKEIIFNLKIEGE